MRRLHLLSLPACSLVWLHFRLFPTGPGSPAVGIAATVASDLTNGLWFGSKPSSRLWRGADVTSMRVNSEVPHGMLAPSPLCGARSRRPTGLMNASAHRRSHLLDLIPTCNAHQPSLRPSRCRGPLPERRLDASRMRTEKPGPRHHLWDETAPATQNKETKRSGLRGTATRPCVHLMIRSTSGAL